MDERAILFLVGFALLCFSEKLAFYLDKLYSSYRDGKFTNVVKLWLQFTGDLILGLVAWTILVLILLPEFFFRFFEKKTKNTSQPEEG